jgi:hypothetical protein
LLEAKLVKSNDSDPILELTRLAYFYQRHGMKDKAEEIFSRIGELRLARADDPVEKPITVEDKAE